MYLKYIDLKPSTLKYICMFMFLIKFPEIVLLHLADAFIQSDLQCIQDIHLLSVHVLWELNTQPLRC